MLEKVSEYPEKISAVKKARALRFDLPEPWLAEPALCGSLLTLRAGRNPAAAGWFLLTAKR